MGILITLGRQFGSGGRELGRKLAEELGIEYYDKEIITGISQHTSLSEEYVKQIVERTPHNIYPITIGETFTFAEDQTFKNMQDVYRAQSTIIRDMAKESDCIIVGRCADYILRDMNPYRMFVYADMDWRVKRCMDRTRKKEEYSTEKQMAKRIKRIDKNRAKYYGFYTALKWGDKANYDICINNTNVDDIQAKAVSLAKMFK